MGFPFLVTAREPPERDDVGLIEMLSDNIDYFKSKPANIPKTTILLDHGYHPDFLMAELKKIYPVIARENRV